MSVDVGTPCQIDTGDHTPLLDGCNPAEVVKSQSLAVDIGTGP